MEQLYPMLQDALITIGGAVITLLAAFAMKAVTRLTQKLEAEAGKLAGEDEQQFIDSVIWRVNSLAATTVTAIEQTTAKALREAVKKGEATPEALKQLSQAALDQICAGLAPSYYDAIEDTYGDAKQYIMNVIEQKVWELKHNPPMV